MTEAKLLWTKDGAPRRPHTCCTFCWIGEVSSHFDDAGCSACDWRGSFTELEELLLSRRPGYRLRELLERREINFAEFAQRTDMGSSYRTALANLRRYTHPTGTRPGKWPKPQRMVRWATFLGVDPGVFYRRE